MTSANQTPGGARKAAILLSVLGEELSAPILRNMHESDLERVADEISRLDRVPVQMTLQVLEEYHQIMAVQDYVAVGGEDVASRMLVKALGENGAKKVVQKLSNPDNGLPFEAEALRKANPQQLARVLASESAQTRALILTSLEPKQASSLLMNMDPASRSECVRRMANMGNSSPSVAARVSAILSKRLQSAGEVSRQEKVGSKNLAEMMNQLGPVTSREILQSIEEQEPELATDIRDLMFTFDNFLEVPDPDLREVINSLDKKTLMIALKGASEELKSRIYRTMSTRAVDMMKEDSEMMGPVRSKEVASAQAEIVATARKLESEGKIVLRSQGDDEYVF